MSKIDFSASPLVAAAVSAINNGIAVTANGATMALGGATGANGQHAHLRFDVNALGLTKDYTITMCVMKLNISTANTPTCGFRVWSSDFGASIAVGDYNLAKNNKISSGPLRANIDEIVPDVANTLNQEFSLYIPSQYMRARTNSVGSPYADFEIRPDVTGVPGASDTITIHGPAAAAQYKPRIVGLAFDNTGLNDDPDSQCVATTDEMVCAFALQSQVGAVTKPTVMLDVVNTSIEVSAGTLVSQAATKSRSKPGRSGPGGVGAGGAITFEITPSRWTKILLSWFELYGTPTTEVIDGTTYYTKVFRVRDACSVPYWTFYQLRGFQRQVFPDVRVGTLNLSDQGLMNGTLSVVGTTGYTYDQYASGVDERYLLASDAAKDDEDNDLLSYQNVDVSLDLAVGTIPSEDIEDFAVTLAQVVSAKRGYNRKRTVSGTFAGALSFAMSFMVYFKNSVLLRNYFGVDHGDFPFQPEKKVINFGATYKLIGELGESRQLIKFRCPKCTVSALDMVDDGSSGAIKLSCTAVAKDVASIGGSVELTIVDEYAGSFYTTADTEEITVLPIED